MKLPTEINTNERVLQVTNYKGITYLCNLGHLTLDTEQRIIGMDNERIVKAKHYWNYKLMALSKGDLKEMISLNKSQ